MSSLKKEAIAIMSGGDLPELSTDWPPQMIDGEEIELQGGFDRKTWLNNLSMWAGFLLIAMWFASSPENRMSSLAMATAALSIGVVISYLINHKSEWIITNRAVYLRGKKPMHRAAIKRIYGAGPLVKIAGPNFHHLSLVGVPEAGKLRALLKGMPV